MHLASINTAEEQRDLQEHIQAYGKKLTTADVDFKVLIVNMIQALYNRAL